jgi:hypothetical protein
VNGSGGLNLRIFLNSPSLSKIIFLSLNFSKMTGAYLVAGAIVKVKNIINYLKKL